MACYMQLLHTDSSSASLQSQQGSICNLDLVSCLICLTWERVPTPSPTTDQVSQSVSQLAGTDQQNQKCGISCTACSVLIELVCWCSSGLAWAPSLSCYGMCWMGFVKRCCSLWQAGVAAWLASLRWPGSHHHMMAQWQDRQRPLENCKTYCQDSQTHWKWQDNDDVSLRTGKNWLGWFGQECRPAGQ